MERNSLKTTFILPPNVNGRCRGTLSLCLHEIKWHSEEPFQFNSILAKIYWWGDSGITLKLKNRKHLNKSFGHVIYYNILTKPTLFRNYLISAERIEIRFSSEISNIDIGKATVPIPTELIGLIDQKSAERAKPMKIRKRCHIFNGQNKNMGELLIEYDLQFYDRTFNQCEIMPLSTTVEWPEQQKTGTENDMNQFNLELDLNCITNAAKKTHKKKSKSSHRIDEKLLEKLPTSGTKRLLCKSTKSSPLLNYLTGRPLGKAEENDAIKAMESTSPTESLIDMLSFDLNGLYLPKKIDSAESKALQKIDCLRIQVNDLCLTRAGTREILSKNALNETSFSSGTFSVIVDLDSILSIKSPFEKNVALTSKVIRIFSSSIETSPPSIDFNRTTVYKLNTFCIKSRNSYANGIISLTVNYCDIESSESRILGTARIHLDDIMEATNLTFHQQCPVTTPKNGIIIGRILAKIELGCRGVHFGADFLEAISSNAIGSSNTLWNDYYSHCSNSNQDHLYRQCKDAEKKTNLKSYRKYEDYEHEHRLNDLLYHSCVYDVHDEQTENKSNTPSTPMNIVPQSSNAQKLNGANIENVTDELTNEDFTHGSSNVDELNDDVENELNGLFYIGQMNYCSWYQSIEETFLVCRPFWMDAALVTDNCLDKTKDETYQLNYLELFSVICDQKLFESTKHGFMAIEVWRRDNNQTNSLIGSAKVPLHQFFIAFNNNNIRNHVRNQELPVISIDGWVTIPYSASPNSTPVGTVQTILAIGTAKQINNFRKSKNLLSCKDFSRLPFDVYPIQIGNACSIPSQPKETRNPASLKSALPQFNDRNSNLAAMFSSFIDTLAARLPERNMNAGETAPLNHSNDATTQTNTSENISPALNNQNSSGPCMRPTSELLDELQRALVVAPTPIQRNAIPTVMQAPPVTIDQNVTLDLKSVSMFRVYIEIESALHLPSIVVHVNKKSGKRNRNSIGSGKKGGSTEIQPSTYATFEAAASPTSNLTSYPTNIMESSCSPQWNKHFEVYLPIEFLQNDEKRFVIRVWRKINDNTPKTRLIPSSSNDVTIGFASVDLSVLMAGLPVISGWFNIIDHSGCINGQIKIHIKPKDDLTIYQKRSQHVLAPNVIETADVMQETGLNAIDMTSNESRAINDSALSRALKRKFTELEEISQRLRARLFDVTADMSMDPDEEFENDLNTIPDEDDDDFEQSNIASEMSLDWLEHCQNQASSNEDSSMAAQMHDIFEFLTPDFGTNQSTSENQSQNIAKITSVDRLNNQPQIASNVTTNDIENTVQNISESLQKSLIKD